MTVVLLEYSFVRRLRDDLLHQLPGTKGPDINPYHSPPDKALKLARHMNITHHFHKAYVAAQGVNLISDLCLPCCVDLVNFVEPDVVFIDIGSNDLANMAHEDPGAILTLVTSLTDYAATLRCKVVILSTVLPRTARLAGSPELFDSIRTQYNTMLYHVCSASEKLAYHSHRGFEKAHTLVSGAEVTRTRAVCEWSDDGIHCNAVAMPRYIQRVRQSILHSACHRSKD